MTKMGQVRQSVLTRGKRRLRRIITGTTAEKECWEDLYRSGEPERYNKLEQFGRYALIEGYCKALKIAPIDILDVGCGAGILAQRLDPRLIGQYVGVDFSPTAIAGARQMLPTARFICADIEKVQFSAGAFDVIVFNESLYYCPDLTSQFSRYLVFLRVRGHAVVSMTDHYGSAQDAFEASFSSQIISETEISDVASGKSWTVYLVSKQGN